MTFADIEQWHNRSHLGPVETCTDPACLAGRALLGPSLSAQLDQAAAMEAYHREQLIWWKRRRKWLETQIPNDSFKELIEELLSDDSNTFTPGH